MSRKAQCKVYCMEVLCSMQCEKYFTQKEFDRQFKGNSLNNIWAVGLTIADNIIKTAKFINNELD